ncbi:MAG: hypothetical protein ACI9VN_003053 [Patescibacteria group bacterium]|jgi:hypothetical protein
MLVYSNEEEPAFSPFLSQIKLTNRYICNTAELYGHHCKKEYQNTTHWHLY